MNTLTIMTIFVVVAAVAIVLQMAILYALYRAARQTSARLEGIASRLESQASPLMETARAILDDAQPKLSEITSNLAESTSTVRANVVHMAESANEIVDRARFQAARMDEFVSNTIAKLELTTEFVQQSVISPVRRIQAILQAVSAGLSVLRAGRSRKKSSGNSTEADEEMFI